MTETTIREFGKEVKMRISCNAIDIAGSDKNHLACAISKRGAINEPSIYLKIDADHIHLMKNPWPVMGQDKYDKTINLRELGW